MSELDLSDDPARLDVTRIHAWLTSSYWSPSLPRATLERAIAGSRVVVGAYDDTGQIGFARAISDGATFAWVADVWVGDGARGRGVGRAMVTYLRAHPDLAGLRRWMLATRDAHGVYAALGFTPLDHPERLMQIYDGVSF